MAWTTSPSCATHPRRYPSRSPKFDPIDSTALLTPDPQQRHSASRLRSQGARNGGEASRLRSSAPPDQGDRDVGERVRQGGVRFVHGDLYGLYALVCQHVVGDPRGDGLDQVARISGDDLRSSLNQRGVIQGPGELVGGRGGTQV